LTFSCKTRGFCPSCHADAWEKRTAGQYGDIPAFYISKQDSIEHKRLVGRKQDLADIEKLIKA